MTIVYHPEVVQGSIEWATMRSGLLTASEMSLIITPTLKAASNEKEKTHLFELLAQRITGYVEPSYISDNMLRGWTNEILARDLYSEKYAPVQEVGFVTNDDWKFKIGYSPDGLVGNDGLIECKSRLQKYQAQTIAENEVPKDFIIQIQTGLLVTGRQWCDYISYCGGMPMFVKRVEADPDIHDAIIQAAMAFEKHMVEKLENYRLVSADLYMTEWQNEDEII